MIFKSLNFKERFQSRFFSLTTSVIATTATTIEIIPMRRTIIFIGNPREGKLSTSDTLYPM